MDGRAGVGASASRRARVIAAFATVQSGWSPLCLAISTQTNHLVYKGEPGPGALWQTPFSMGRRPPPETLGLLRGGAVAGQKGLCCRRIQHKTVQGSPWGDALQQKDSDAAIKSFWRCTFVEIWSFLWSRWSSPGVPGGSPGGVQEVQGAQGIYFFSSPKTSHNVTNQKQIITNLPKLCQNHSLWVQSYCWGSEIHAPG